MEIEDLLKDAAEWRPSTEMPADLERRALKAVRRPPLRPMGIMRPRSALFATALAGVACFFMIGRVGQKPLEPVGVPVAIADTRPTPAPTREHIKETLPIKPQIDRQAKRSKKRKTSRRQSPLTQRLPVALDTVSDSVIVGSRVAVDAPVYTPAYYAEPSSDGESTKYTPVKVALDDPDVIYSESPSEFQKEN
ncbi:MAG: hypothetical protein NTX57_07925 [Armatimonadetes bacterium]|nr:hypothetical protein [Armatimonadota bacterium]